jgi:hypothetical protein
LIGDAKTFNQLIIEHTHAAGRNRTHRQFFVTGDAKLANDKDVHRRDQPARHLIGDGHAAARQRQHDRVRPIDIGGELVSEPTAGVTAIAKQIWFNEGWIHVSSSSLEAACAQARFAKEPLANGRAGDGATA